MQHRVLVPRHGFGGSIATLTACTHATLFHDCFAGPSGTISTGSPGPIQGWTFGNPFGGKSGLITFTPGQMNLVTNQVNASPGAHKPLPASLPTVKNTTTQFTFSEFPLPTGVGRFYDQYVLGATEFVEVKLNDNGNVFVVTGPNNNADFYAGTWTPVSGATNKVHVTVSPGNVPSLWIDNVSIPLIFGGSGSSLIGGFVADTVTVLDTATGAPGPVSSVFTRFFVTTGNLPPTTNFCC